MTQHEDGTPGPADVTEAFEGVSETGVMQAAGDGPAGGMEPVTGAALNGAAGETGSDEEAPDVPAPADWPEHDPGRKALSCGECGEQFAGDPGLPFTSPVLAEALADAVAAAGWKRDGDAWTCSVCLAKADAEPEPEAEPAESGPAPAADYYAESVEILREFDAAVPGCWADINHANTATAHKIYLRTGDRAHGIREQFASAPGLLGSPELGEALHQGEVGLGLQLRDMRQASAVRDEWLQAQRHAPAAGNGAAA